MVGRDDNGDQRALLLTNFELIERANKGDQQAFRALYDENVERIYRLAYRMAGEEDLAQDFTQEAVLRAYQTPAPSASAQRVP
jgi:DNA-directed RNA polymerase specialized sigma24 family protein